MRRLAKLKTTSQRVQKKKVVTICKTDLSPSLIGDRKWSVSGSRTAGSSGSSSSPVLYAVGIAEKGSACACARRLGVATDTTGVVRV